MSKAGQINVAGGGPSLDASDGAPAKVTRFDFQHRVFSTPGSRFKLWGSDRRPVFSVDVGRVEGIIELKDLCREFCIDQDSHDGRLIKLAGEVLRYVPDIKPGDAVPSEILTGEASWKVQARHTLVAQKRLHIQLLSWASGKELILTDPGEIALYLEQMENREKLKVAFRSAAIQLGLAEDDTDGVLDRLDKLGRELSYIEALRDRYALVQRLERRLAELTRNYSGDRGASGDVQRTWQLAKQGASDLEAIFAQIDAQTGEIIAALKGVERQIVFIRKTRDELLARLSEWDPHIDGLERWPVRRSPEADKAVASLYRFLAARFAVGRSMLESTRAGAKRSSPTPLSRPRR